MEEQFRDQAELIARRLDDSVRAQAELIDGLFLARDQKWDVRLGRMEKDVSTLKTDVNTLKADVGALKKRMTIVREGIGILLIRRG